MRKCLHCPHEGEDDTFAFYKDVEGNRRARNVCMNCWRLQSQDRQVKYKEKHGDRVREAARDRRYLRYHSDPEFRQRCLDQSKKRSTYESS